MRINHKASTEIFEFQVGLNPGEYSRKLGIGVRRPGSYTLTLFKDETNENWSP